MKRQLVAEQQPRPQHQMSSHGHPLRWLYTIWIHMKERCYNRNHHAYKNYGGRGIAVFDEWRRCPLVFAAYITATIGERPVGYTLDRIDNDGNYEPGNLRWASRGEQQQNKRCKTITYNGETKSLAQWSKDLGISLRTIAHRESRGLSVDLIFSQPRPLDVGNPKLTQDIVKQARRLYLEGRTQTSIALQFGVARSTISALVKQQTWR